MSEELAVVDGSYVDTHGVKKHRLSVDEVNELMKDWFDRDSELFVKVTPEMKASWEETKAEESYGTFLSKSIDKNGLVKRAYQIALNFLVIMGTPKFRLQIDNSKSWTDGSRVAVSTEVFDEESYDLGERIDVFIGLAVHEGCHLKYTDFTTFTRFPEMKKEVIRGLQNVIEDERIEMSLADEKPTLIRYIEKTKYYYFDTKYLDSYTEKPDSEPLNKIMGIFLRIIRFPRYIDSEDIEYFGDYLWRIKEALTPYPTNTRGSIVAAIAVWEILKELYKDKKEEELKLLFDLAGGADGEPDDERPEFVLTPEMEAEIEKELEKVSIDEGKKLVQIAKGFSEDDKMDIPLAKKLDKHLPSILVGEYERGSSSAFVLKAKDNRIRYESALANVRQFIPAVKKAIKYNDKDYKIAHKSMRSGNLDTGKIVEAKQGVPTVYERFGMVKTDKICVGLVADLSGSMDGTKIQKARETCILLYEALKDNHSIELFIYGHTADETETYCSDVYVYSEPGYRPKYSLGSMVALTQNRDGDAIRACADRIRSFTANRCLMFVISDGAPAAHGYSGAMGVADTKNAVKYAERMNMDVCQIAIEASYNPALMFKHFVKLTNIHDLPRDLGRFIKKQILNKQHIGIS